MTKRDKAEDRDQQILSRLAHIEHKVDSIDETNAFALRAEADKHKETVKKIFRHGKRRAQVYLAADGSRGVDEVAKHLGMKHQNVSPQLRILKEEGLLELVDATARMIFSIQRYLEDYFNRRGLSDPDQYAVNLAKLYDRERHGKTVHVFLSSMNRIRTVFYKRNSHTRREVLERRVLTLLDSRFKKKDYSSSQRQSPQELKHQESA